MNDLTSYTAANTLPAKLLQAADLVRRIKGGFIPPVHVQLNPTNRCNLNCDFCSCSERDKNLELDPDRLTVAMEKFMDLGCKSVTITGGGEPLLYPYINSLIPWLAEDMGIKVGLVTNGTQFLKLNDDVYRHLTWCRISSSDDREPDWQSIKWAVDVGSDVDWAFSHVVTRKPRWDYIEDLVRFANFHKAFTHVRLVGDILDINQAAHKVHEAKIKLNRYSIDDSKVIYQSRAEYVHGRRDCRISLLKPVVGADGGIYPCCGVQYAQNTPGRDYVSSMRMGWLEDIGYIWEKQTYFCGLDCVRCYYDNYNGALELMSLPLNHERFV
jgi:organic radical activating enzyme